MALHVGIGHAEGINTDLNTRLPKDQRASDKLENLIDAAVGHGVAADGDAGTVNHQIFAFVTVRAVIGVRETNIDGFIKAAIGFELTALDVIKTFRTFKVPTALFRT